MLLNNESTETQIWLDVEQILKKRSRWNSIKKFLSNKGKEWLKITKELITKALKEENQG